MQSVRVVGVTAPMAEGVEDAAALVAYCARVSNPANQLNSGTAEKLLQYCVKNAHWSVFEMVNVVLEVNCPRDIARQILRHRSFSFQEFCVAGDTRITLELPSGVVKGKRAAYSRTIEHLYSLQERGLKLPSGVRVFDEGSKTFVVRPIKEVFKAGLKPAFRVTLANGKSIVATKEHKFLTDAGFVSMEEALGLRLVGDRAVAEKQVAFACNGVPVYKDRAWMAAAKEDAIASGGGLQAMAASAGVTAHTIRKWLRKHGLQFTKAEVSLYTPVWNKGVYGYSRAKHSLETLEKMRASARRGEDSNLWRGGVSRSERLKIADWCNSHRAEFLRKANYRCGSCGSKDKLELHHIEPVYQSPDLAYEKTNIQVLCQKCHRDLHNTRGDAKVWRADSKGRNLTVCWSMVTKVEYVGEIMTYDLEVDHPSHNYVANGIVTHNSQRYADATQLEWVGREARLQDEKNRQNSVEVDDEELKDEWGWKQAEVMAVARHTYKWALERGIAKEVARAVLPEGLMMSRMYMNGTLRSWIHYCDLRRGNGTQKEHREVAEMAWQELCKVFGFLTRMGR